MCSAYALIQAGSTLRVIYLLRSPNSPLASTDKKSAGEVRRREANACYALGAIIFLAGFAVWNVDNAFCAQLRAWRTLLTQRGLWMLAPLLQGHALWHLGTGLGAYQLVVSSSLLVMSLKETPENFELQPGPLPLGLGRLVPVVRRVRPWNPAGKKDS